MVNPNDRLQYKDVISKGYIGPVNTIEAAMTSFMEELLSLKYKFIGPLFFSVQLDENGTNAKFTFYMPLLNEPASVENGFMFHSYFTIGQVFSTYMKGDFEDKLALENNMLLECIQKEGYRPVSPLFIQLLEGEKISGCFLKIAVLESPTIE